MNFTSSESHCLVASPILDPEPFFQNSVVLITEKHDGRYVGVVLNKESHISLLDLSQKHDLDLNEEEAKQHHISIGGPIMSHQIFALHHICSQYILEPCTLSEIKGYLQFHPHVKFFVGFSGWSIGLLETEISKGYWLTLPPCDALIFNQDFKACYSQALKSLKIDHPGYLSGDIAHA